MGVLEDRAEGLYKSRSDTYELESDILATSRTAHKRIRSVLRSG